MADSKLRPSAHRPCDRLCNALHGTVDTRFSLWSVRAGYTGAREGSLPSLVPECIPYSTQSIPWDHRGRLTLHLGSSARDRAEAGVAVLRVGASTNVWCLGTKRDELEGVTQPRQGCVRVMRWTLTQSSRPSETADKTPFRQPGLTHYREINRGEPRHRRDVCSRRSAVGLQIESSRSGGVLRSGGPRLGPVSHSAPCVGQTWSHGLGGPDDS
jgi:hypothetical protein